MAIGRPYYILRESATATCRSTNTARSATSRRRPSRPATPRRAAGDGARYFCVQKHLASHLHYDFRLEHDGVLLSWAVPKGPSLDPSDKRLAMQTEDHPLDYGAFEGVIPEGYGAGIVMLWDSGTWTPESPDVDAALKKGDLKFRLEGFKLKGSWVLVRTRGYGDSSKPSWLLIKHKDEWAGPIDITEFAPLSVKTPDADFADILAADTRPCGTATRRPRAATPASCSSGSSPPRSNCAPAARRSAGPADVGGEGRQAAGRARRAPAKPARSATRARPTAAAKTARPPRWPRRQVRRSRQVRQAARKSTKKKHWSVPMTPPPRRFTPRVRRRRRRRRRARLDSRRPPATPPPRCAAIENGVGVSKWDLDTPALCVDLDALESNIATMQARLKRLRPRRPAARQDPQDADIAKLQLAAGALGICTAKVSEAEVLMAAASTASA